MSQFDILLLLLSTIVWAFTIYGFWIGMPKIIQKVFTWLDNVEAWVRNRN